MIRRALARPPLTAGLATLATVVALALVPGGFAPATAATSSADGLAPVLGDAGDGGAVIVRLTDQLTGLSLRDQPRFTKAAAEQKPIADDITASGGTDVVHLVSVNAVAATVSAAEVAHLRTLPGVMLIEPDGEMPVGDPEPVGPLLKHATVVPDTVAAASAKQAKSNHSADATPPNNFPTDACGTQADPLIEPEGLQDVHAPADTGTIADGTEPGSNVVVANAGINKLAANPNFTRPDGTYVVKDAPAADYTDPTVGDISDGEYYGDASTIAAQGTVEYQYATELPFSGISETCYFKLVGDAPGASLVDTTMTTYAPSQQGDPAGSEISESQAVAQIDAAVRNEHADVINESYGYTNTPGSFATHFTANDTAVAAGVTIVVSSGDSGYQGTASSPAVDPTPGVIEAGATNTLRENAMAYGFAGWVNDDITPLSSGGPAFNGKLPDIVAPGYGAEAACSKQPKATDCTDGLTATEAFGGTSEAAPFVAGGAADVIWAYRNSHDGNSPSPALVQEVLTGTASDVDAPADQQGAGQLNIEAAMKAAEALPNSTEAPAVNSTLVPTSATQFDLTGDGGTTSNQSLTVYNPSSSDQSVTGTFRSLGTPKTLGDVVTENVSAPDPSADVPADGADAAPAVPITVPAGLDRLDVKMIWPDATNGTILNFVLTDPSGRLRNISYDYGSAPTKAGALGTVPDIQDAQVRNPEAGTWTVQIKWGNGRSHLQEAPNVPGSYTGTVSVRATGQTFVTSPASAAVTVPAGGTAQIPFTVAFPQAPGDYPQSLQLTNADGDVTSVPVSLRTLVPDTSGSTFDATIQNSVGRGLGAMTTQNITVAAGTPDLDVAVADPDASTDQAFTLALISPTQTKGASVAATVKTINGTPMLSASAHVANPAAGTWEIDELFGVRTSGKEFEQVLHGTVLAAAPPVITSPTTGTTVTTARPTISGTGVAGDTATVQATVSGVVTALCSALVGSDGTWSCPTSALAKGTYALTAYQTDPTSGLPTATSTAVSITVPTVATVSLAASPTSPEVGDDITLTATTTNVADGSTVTFLDGSDTLGSGTVTGNTASLDLPTGLGVGDHTLTASVPPTSTTTSATSDPVDLVVARHPTTVSLALDPASPAIDQAVTLTATTTGVADGATVTFLDGTMPLGTGTIASGTATLALPDGFSAGDHTLTASVPQTDTTAASTSAPVEVDLAKASTTVALTVDPAAPTIDQAVTLTAATTGVPDGTTVTFLDGATTLGLGTVTGGTASLPLPLGFAAGDHPLTASVPETDFSDAAVSPEVDVMIAKNASTIVLTLDKASVQHGQVAGGTVQVGGGAASGTVTVTTGQVTKTVTVDSTGHGTFTLPADLTMGAHLVHAVYNGNDETAASAVATATLHVVKRTTTTSENVRKATVARGGVEKVTVHVRGRLVGPFPTGTVKVHLKLGSATRVASAKLTSADKGVVTVSVPVPHKAGKAKLYSRYLGDVRFTVSQSPIATAKVK